MADASTDIFLSYASEDRARVSALVERLESEGFSVWWDRAIEPGSHFRKVIDDALQNASCVVVAWSHNSVRSDWVIGEALIGFDRGRLVPVTLNDVRIPLPFNAASAARLDRNDPAEYNRLVTAIRSRILGTPTPRVAPTNLLSRRRPVCAVLQFDAFGDAASEPYAQGIAADLIAALSHSSSLDVLSRHTSFAPHLRSLDIAAIGSALDAEFVITGTVSLRRQELHVAAELAEAGRGVLIWSGRYQRSLDTVADLQTELAEQIAREVGVEFVRLPVDGLREASTWVLYHKARNAFFAYDSMSLAMALDWLEQALQLDADDVVVRSFKATVHAERWLNRFVDDPEADAELARREIETALKIKSDNSLVLKYAGNVYSFLGEHELAINYLRRSVSHNPLDLGTWGYFGWSLAGSSDSDDQTEIEEILLRVLLQAPNHPGIGFWRAHQATSATVRGDFETAAERASQAVQINPSMAIAWWQLANSWGALGNEPRAREAAGNALRRNPAMTLAHYRTLVRLLSRDDQARQQRTMGLRGLT